MRKHHIPKAVLYNGDLVSPMPCREPVVIRLIASPGWLNASILRAVTI